MNELKAGARGCWAWVLLALGLLLLGACSADPPEEPDATSIAQATVERDFETLKRTFEEHPEAIRQADAFGYTPLHRAAARGDRRMVEFLLRHGADPNARNRMGQTPLHGTAQQGLTFIVESLLEKGADVNATDEDGMTPLHLSAEVGCAESLQALLVAGADPFRKNLQGERPRDLAVKMGHLNLLPLLPSGDAPK